jgi:hypothetical protein
VDKNMLNITKIDQLNIARELEGICDNCGYKIKIISCFDVDENGTPIDLDNLADYPCIKCGGNL